MQTLRQPQRQDLLRQIFEHVICGWHARFPKAAALLTTFEKGAGNVGSGCIPIQLVCICYDSNSQAVPVHGSTDHLCVRAWDPIGLPQP